MFGCKQIKFSRCINQNLLSNPSSSVAGKDIHFSAALYDTLHELLLICIHSIPHAILDFGR